MKNLAFVAAFALLALALPASGRPGLGRDLKSRSRDNSRTADRAGRCLLEDVQASHTVLLGRAGHLLYGRRSHQGLYRRLLQPVELHLHLLLFQPERAVLEL